MGWPEPRAAHAPLTAALPDFPAVLGLGCGNGLPLKVRYGVGSAATERDDVILAVAAASEVLASMILTLPTFS
jgi:hypothetical protein